MRLRRPERQACAFAPVLTRAIRSGIVILGVLLGLSPVRVFAGTAEDPKEVPDSPAYHQLAPLTTGPGATGGTVLFPPTAEGYPGELRSPRDVAPFLAFEKAAAMKRLDKAQPQEEPDPREEYYDARYYALDLTLNPTAKILTGKVTDQLTVVVGPLSQVVLDLTNNMAVLSVTSAGTPVTFSHPNDLLTVNLERPYNVGETITLVVHYSGNPAGDAFGWGTQGGHPMIWTLSEAFGARNWWPCKDYPEDKADSVDVRVTVPTGLITAGNGVLRDHWDNGVNAFTWWHESYPITTYLVMFSSTPYYVYSDWYKYSPTDSMEIRFHNFPSSIPAVVPVQAKVKTMIATFASLFGQYPFLKEKYGHAEFLWGGGMEHETCTSLGYFGESVVAHELSHQWWGDMITCHDFHNIWLNEGFATYCQALWDEEANGGYSSYMQDMYATEYFGSGTIYVPDTSDWNRIFDSNLSYDKASWVLHMLRGIVGDTTFFQILQAYHQQYQYSTATTEQFRDVAEAVSGRDLHAFFQEWIYGEYYPIYQYSWSSAANGGGYDVTLDVKQLQTWQLFSMPIQIVVTTQAGDQSFQINDTQADQVFTLHVTSLPSNVALDPNTWILRQVFAPIPPPSFDRNILLVNGLDWSVYGAGVTSAYQDNAFTGNYAYDFWDCFPTPSGGYPTNMPAPLGHGDLPPDVLAHYKTLIWVGGDYGGDDINWADAPIYSYLAAGGNVLLSTRMADAYLADPYRAYLGVTWLGEGTPTDCIATLSGLTNIGLLGSQSYTAGFDTNVGANSTLLYKAVAGFNPNWGIGVIQEPPGGGLYNPKGAKFCLLSGRPYQWVHSDLSTNISWILANKFGLTSAGAGPVSKPAVFQLDRPFPNPFGVTTTVRFSLASEGRARLTVWDVTGRKVATLLDGEQKAGIHSVTWDGSPAGGHPVAAGIYYVRLEEGNQKAEGRLLRLR